MMDHAALEKTLGFKNKCFQMFVVLVVQVTLKTKRPRLVQRIKARFDHVTCAVFEISPQWWREEIVAALADIPVYRIL